MSIFILSCIVELSNLDKIEKMIDLNVKAVVILSSLFVRDYENVKGTKLINISSAGGYIIVPTAVTYCASKFFISSYYLILSSRMQETQNIIRNFD